MTRFATIAVALVLFAAPAAAKPGPPPTTVRPCAANDPACNVGTIPVVPETTVTFTFEPIPLAPIPSTPRFTG